jgi:glucan phosphoethanolaminetransferase (alkaline phosphatase superfamily)
MMAVPRNVMWRMAMCVWVCLVSAAVISLQLTNKLSVSSRNIQFKSSYFPLSALSSSNDNFTMEYVEYVDEG